MAYANKTYVAFDADNNIHYYRMMTAWKKNSGVDFNFYDAHDLNNLRDGSSEETIKRRLAERFQSAKLFVLLVGDNTRYLYKFVRWEIEQALKRELPIVAVNLNGLRQYDDERCPPILDDELAIHISFNQKILEYAMEYWPTSFSRHKKEGKRGPFYYEDFTYTKLGL